jgi:hypothetical protein
MLYVNGTETQLLQRLEVTDKFTGNTPTTLEFTGDISRKIYKGQVRIQYGDTGYGVLFKVDEGSCELSECIQTMVLNEGETLQNGHVQPDTLLNGNQISVRNEKNQDHEGTYRLRNDTLYHSYTPAGWQWQQEGKLFHPHNPISRQFVNYRNGNKVFRFVWVKQNNS